MALHLSSSSSPSSILHDHHCSLHNTLSPHYLKPKPKTFAYPLKFKFSTIFSIKDTILEQTQNTKINNLQNPDGKTTSSSKPYIWVNPNSPRASKLRKQSYDSRYSFLVKIAESLNTCNKDDVFEFLSGLGEKILEQDAVVVLNNMDNADNASIVLNYLLEKIKARKEVILYNVTLKVFRKCKDLKGAEKLFDEMLRRGVKPDNVTFSTIISCARVSSVPSKAIEWFEKMPQFGCDPDDVTYSTMIDAYARAGFVHMALNLYDRARNEKWRIDVVTFSTLIRIYGQTKNFDGCLNVYEEMKALKVKPNLVVYNTLLDAMGRAQRPWQVKIIYKDMINNGLTPNGATYASLLHAYSKARYGEDAMSVYREMKDKGMELNVILYNSLLAMCADVGYVDEALEIFEEMKKSKTSQPDSWTFSSIITIYSCSGKVEEAEAVFNEMLEAGFEPNLFVLTSLIQCYGKAQRTDDVVSAFNRLSELGIIPDDRFCGCLLNVMTQSPPDELSKLVGCVERANAKLGTVVKLLVEDSKDDVNFKEAAAGLFQSISPDVKKAYCNCLIDLCVNSNLLEKACVLLDLGLSLEIYTNIQSRSATQWSLHLKSLSLGAALTALHVWINDLTKALEDGEELPPLLGINTGHGKHKYSDKGLASVFESHLKELNAPFHEAPDKVGWFLTTKVAAKTWLESRSSVEAVAS